MHGGRILKTGRNCFEVAGVDQSGVYVDAEEYYTAFHMAAREARDYIAISGWQFDSEVALLRGRCAQREAGEVRLLRFLDSLCRENPALRIYILAWDFSLIFMHEREWMQEIVFNWSTSDRLLFRFDDKHAIGASQHQKFVIIDGAAAFLGGMDLCAGRWDDRCHRAVNPDRVNPDGGAYGPYHDVQAYFTGELIGRLLEVFTERWKLCTGNELSLPAPRRGRYLPPGIGTPIRAGKAALSRTQGQTFVQVKGPVKEIRSLYVDAIRAARELVYIENQYFSSYAVYRALMDRMEDETAPPIDIVLILPKKPSALVEEISVGLLQARILSILRQTAQRKGHSFGVYYSTSFDGDGEEVPVYIHSKLVMVDDRFATVGSANTTNRSMGLDTEINISWEASPLDLRLMRSIRKLRLGLLLEHIGPDRHISKRKVAATRGLVEYLDFIAEKRLYKLQRHSFSSYFEGSDFLKTIDELLLDPEKAVIEENVFEIFSPDMGSVFSEGMRFLKNWVSRKKAG
jgi:phosphatidylserine/phosphatidylglycerophosphate/cardiolipin synthase-like enzyme